jgi:hypothetical protein
LTGLTNRSPPATDSDCLINATAWWKAVVSKESLTPEEVNRIRMYTEMYRPAARRSAGEE